jgi:alpha-L-fucosidase 2
MNFRSRLFMLACVAIWPASAADRANVLWYRQPATKWTEALPIGNGRLGAMVFGGVGDERIQLNEGTVWAGEKRDRNNPAGATALAEVRRLLFAGKPTEAEALAGRDMIAIPSRMPPYQTLGDLNLRFGDQEPTNYTRELDLDTAIVSVSYRASGSVYTREIFASAAGQVMVIRLTCDRPNRISFRAALSREQDAATKSDGADRIVMDGKAMARDPAHDAEGQAGVRFRAVLTGIAEGGKILTEGSELLVDHANAVTLLIAAATDFRGNSPETACDARINAARKPYEQLRAEHVADYQRYFHRVRFQLAGAAPDLPTDERLSRATAGASDPLLATLYFQFGRYLSISSSRPGGMPATLQGLWNESLAPSWESKYTININTEMNYWPAEVCNLSEMHEPLFDLVDAARPDGRQVAQALYHAGGFVLHHNTDIWGDAVPIDGVNSGLWPMGGAWLSLHFWDHYDFTRDRDFLARRAYPVMKEAAQFLLDYMVDDGQGHLVTGPSISPENGYRLANGVAARLCMGPYMDTEIAYALFSRVLESEQILDVDAVFGKRVAAARDRLTPFRIGKHGQLQEWLEDYDEVEPGHRHISHLFALYPGNQITLRGTPELAQAARTSLERRLAAGGGRTGWSRAWVINVWARLEEGDLAYESLRLLLANSTLPDMLDTHPPFQIDGNFGGIAGIAEMLLQSHAGEISLLPALPKAWPEGSIHGLRARGAVEVGIVWAAGRASAATLRPDVTGTYRIRPPGTERVARVSAEGKAVSWNENADGVVAATLERGRTYEVAFR